MGVTRLAIHRPIAILMLIIALVGLGLLSYFKLPAELNPKVDFGVITVSTTYAGTSPQEMETLITKPIEDSISGVSGLREVTSTSQQGISTITCQLYIGTDLDATAADLRQKIDAVRKVLPTEADSPVIQKRDTSAQPIMYLAMRGPHSSRDLRVLADNVIVERLQQAPDVASISVFGGDVREIRIGVQRDRLAAYGVTVSQLANAIQAANANVAAGYIQKGNQYYSIRFLGQFASVPEIKNLQLSFPAQAGTAAAGTSGDANGSATTRVVRLSDIATISDTTAERTQESTVDGSDTVLLAIQKTSDGNTLKAVSGIKQQLKEVQKIIPSDIEFVTTVDTSKQVNENLNDVVVSLTLGAFLAILIVYLFLHNIRATAIVALAIPTCVIATFLPISAMGFTLNSMTLLGLSLAIGVLVDDSIVVLENIVRHLSMGEDPVTAAIRGRSEIGLAALTLTSVDLVVFVPISFMGGVIGEFFRSFGAAISISVLLSLLVSFTLTPMLASRWFKKGEALESDGSGQGGFKGWFNRGYKKVEHRYQRFLRVCLRHPWIVVGIGTAALVAVLMLVAPKLGFRFAPGQDQSLVAVSVEAPAGASLAYTKRITDEVERRIKADDWMKGKIKYILTSVGQSNSTGSGNTGTQYGNMQVSLFDKAAPLDKLPFAHHPEPLRDVEDSAVAAHIRELTRDIPGANIQANEVNGFGGGGAPLNIRITGADTNQLLAATAAVEAEVAKGKGVYNVDSSYKASQPEVQIRLDRVRAANYGLALEDVSNAVSATIQGDIRAKYRDPADNEQYNIRVQLSDLDRNNVYDVGQIPVGTQNGTTVKLSDVANLTYGVGPTRVDRLNRLREISVTAFLASGTQIGNVQQKVDPGIKKLFATGKFGATSYVWGGEAQSLAEEGPYLLTAIAMGVVLSYMLMAALFNNVLYPLSVMLTLPQALVGALLILFLTHTPLSLIAAIGVIMLNGLAAKNAILMVDYTNTLRGRGYKIIDALLTAAPTRLRPILMTSSAIIFASLPTAMALGRGAGFRQPLAIVVVGGVFVSTILTLIVIPCTYLLFDRFSDFVSGGWRRRRKPTETSPTPPPAPPTNGHSGDGNGKAKDSNGNGHTALSPTDTPLLKERPAPPTA
ncbi:MAG: efflux RND transporter permease subunit [Capsulimonas sp.]|uniref:efflux RND transporter permease subunit n=1 Tax=Capsulimonas sp. TaxID=2494211 RepID=UPI0032649C20